MTEKLFFDTYALIEIFKGNNNYEDYKKFDIVITKLNLFELYYNILNIYGENYANIAIEKYSNFITDFNKNIIINAAKMRLIFKKQNVSMTDCIGYVKAKELGIKFLTGDNQFEFLPDVEFVK